VMEHPTYLFQDVGLYSVYSRRYERSSVEVGIMNVFVVVVLCPDTVGEWDEYETRAQAVIGSGCVSYRVVSDFE
jgi:hypothetical protein